MKHIIHIEMAHFLPYGHVIYIYIYTILNTKYASAAAAVAVLETLDHGNYMTEALVSL